MNREQVNWKRIESFLLQKARGLGKSRIDVTNVIETLQEIIKRCGEFSQNRKMLQRIGTCLLQNEVTIVVPVCLITTVRKTGTTTNNEAELPTLAQKHIVFLRELIQILPTVKVIFLIPDQEAQNKDLCGDTGKSQTEFLDIIRDTFVSISNEIGPLGWTARYMTEVIPNLPEKETEVVSWVSSESGFGQRINTETLERIEMYRLTNRSLTVEEMRKRTLNTASQYVVLGRWASECGFIVCSHTTTSLSWYLQTEVAVLHNPVSVH